MLLVHRDHYFASNKKVNFGELKKEPFILYRKDFSLYDQIIEECSKNNFQPNIVCESSQKDFILAMVEAKLGVALIPSEIYKQLNNVNVTALHLNDTEMNLELGMAWKKNKYLSFAVREFISMSKLHLLK